MKLFKTIRPGANTVECFVFPDSFTYEAVAKYIGKIKSQSYGFWYRVSRNISFCTSFTSVSELSKAVLQTEFKYIRFKDNDLAEDILVLFSKSVDHDCLEEIINVIADASDLDYFLAPVSAGFTDLKTCYGYSETLSLKSSEEDTKLLERMR